MLENIGFTYDGIHSSEMGVINCKVSSGLYDEVFLPTRSISEESVPRREKPYFKTVDYEPLEFQLFLYFDEGMSSEKRRRVARWLVKDYYKPLIFDSSPSQIFYCIYTGDSRLLHNGLEEGYVEITMRCDSRYSYSPYYDTGIYDLSSNSESGTEIIIENYGDDYCKPYIYLEKIDDGNISIVNITDNGREMKFSNLIHGDYIIVDNEHEQIDTGIPGVYRYENHNNVYLRLLPNTKNYLMIYGTCKVKFTYRFKMYQR